jgi:hypothetical protein
MQRLMRISLSFFVILGMDGDEEGGFFLDHITRSLSEKDGMMGMGRA